MAENATHTLHNLLTLRGAVVRDPRVWGGYLTEAAGRRYVELAGGPGRLLESAHRAYEDGDFRWAAEVLSHLVFADPSHGEARELEAAALDQLGFGAENGTWRNFFLTGASELRGAAAVTPTETASPDLMAALTLTQLFDSVAIRVNGPHAWSQRLAIEWEFTDTGDRYHTALANGVLVHGPGPGRDTADARVGTTRAALLALLGGAPSADLAAAGDLTLDGAADALDRLTGVLEPPDPGFAIVLP
jgi:alkyl sulfatase BDS1-like metallo-beta-lactamase superfamily hydrolase